MSEAMKCCYDLLSRAGRSYELCLRHLEPEMRAAQSLLYLVARAIDTIEDDVAIPNDVKVTLLTSFDKYLRDPTWKYTSGNEEFSFVLENFPIITKALGEISAKYRDIILETGTDIGHGMAKFVGKPWSTIEDVDQYCKAVTYVFSVGSYRLFVVSGMESGTPTLLDLVCCVQKTNLIRDFWKDWNCGILLYPTEVWSKYVKQPRDLLEPDNFEAGVQCVNELVTDALRHVPPGLRALHSLKSSEARTIFGMYLMSIATLERCHNSSRPFTEVVKVGRGEMEEMVESASSLGGILNTVRLYTDRILASAHQTKHPTPGTVEACQQILLQIEQLQSNQN